MKRALILAMILSGPFLRLRAGQWKRSFFQSAGPVTTVGVGLAGKGPGAPVQGAPYSATMSNEMVQTLSDGTHITQTSTGNVARDSQGRTRQDAPFAADRQFVRCRRATPCVHSGSGGADGLHAESDGQDRAENAGASHERLHIRGANRRGPSRRSKIRIQVHDSAPPGAPPPGPIMMQRFVANDQDKATTEDLGTQTMEGVQVTGVRTTRTIPAGEIGNDQPISIVTEVWTSPDLKAIVYSKRTDPRMGEQTFQLTNIVRNEPDASLFTVPADFKIVDGPQDVIYRSNQ